MIYLGTLIIWGPAQRILIGNKYQQGKVKATQDDVVLVEASIACAMIFGFVEKIKALGIPVPPMGMPFTEYLKSDWKVLTF